MINFGTMRPKLIAKIMRIAFEPSASVAPLRFPVPDELLASWITPLAILNMKTPGIIVTTEAKPTAAKGMCQRRDTCAMMTPTKRHAIKAPIAEPAPSAKSAVHLNAWATAPTAIGHGSIFNGEEKNTLKQATATPAAMTSCHRGMPIRRDNCKPLEFANRNFLALLEAKHIGIERQRLMACLRFCQDVA